MEPYKILKMFHYSPSIIYVDIHIYSVLGLSRKDMVLLIEIIYQFQFVVTL